jgi:integrase
MRKATDEATGVLKERFTEHDIRAKTATDDPLNAQQRLGHKNRAMTDRYVKVRKIEKVKPLVRNI